MRPRRCLSSLVALLAVTALAAGCTSSGARDPSTAPPRSSSADSASTTAVAPSSSAAPVPGSSATTSAPPARLTYRGGLALPDGDVTPGSALAGVTRTQVCTAGWNAAHNKIGYAIRNTVSSRYGKVAGPGTSLHLDQLIPASLGGDVTASNVWPQPESQLRRKNDLEAHLHQLVCAGSLALTTAQRALADDWTAALRRYPPA